jgi:hypothetical protein
MQNQIVNYQKWLNEKLKELENGKKPTLLLHACCAPCSTYCLDYLKKYFDITILFYNPNISPTDEYERRLNEITRYIKYAHKTDNIKLKEIGYNPSEYNSLVKGLEDEKEGGMRCLKCYRLRLEKTAQIAKENNYDFFTTTLTISPYKNSAVLNQIGKEVAEKFNVGYLFSDFKKNDGYKKSIEFSKKYDLYRQDYCGCIYSKRDYDKRLKEKKEILKNAS